MVGLIQNTVKKPGTHQLLCSYLVRDQACRSTNKHIPNNLFRKICLHITLTANTYFCMLGKEQQIPYKASPAFSPLHVSRYYSRVKSITFTCDLIVSDVESLSSDVWPANVYVPTESCMCWGQLNHVTHNRPQPLIIAMSDDFCKCTLLTFQLQNWIELSVSFKLVYSFPMLATCAYGNP